MKIKQGDKVRVETERYAFTPSGRVNETHGPGVEGTVVRIRTKQGERKVTVELSNDPGYYADWSVTDIEKVSA